MYRVKPFTKTPQCSLPVRERASEGQQFVRLTLANVCECDAPKDEIDGLFAPTDTCRIVMPKIRKKIPFSVPLSPYSQKSSNEGQSASFFVQSMLARSNLVLRERPRKDLEGYLKDRLRRLECTPSSGMQVRHHMVRPPRQLTNREIADKIMRRKMIRERKCGDRLGPFNATVPLIAPHGMFDRCHSESSCRPKENQEKTPVEVLKKDSKQVHPKDSPSDEIDALPTKIDQQTSVTNLNDYINDQVVPERNPDEAVYMLDWHPKPTPCKHKLKARGECRGSEENLAPEENECTCGPQFKTCEALNFLQRRDPFYKWMKEN